VPALDICHPQVVKALQKAGWVVSPHPFAIPNRRRNPLLADIRAERNENQIIIAEVKCFEKNSLDELYTAIGQYIVYRSLMSKMPVIFPLYLAIPSTAYYGIFKEIGLDIVNEMNIKLIVIDRVSEVIELWIN
jgi:XisH protein